MTPVSDVKSRLFRKYAGIFVFLVTGALLVSGGVELFVGYQERRSSLAEFERERSASAALTIEQFIGGIIRQVQGAADNPQPTDATGIERRRTLVGVLHIAGDSGSSTRVGISMPIQHGSW